MVVALNYVDNKKKHETYKSMNRSINDSDYITRFHSLLDSFSINDSINHKSIKKTLRILEDDFAEIDYSEIYIKNNNNGFYRITSNYSSRYDNLTTELDFVKQEINKFIIYLDNNPNPDIDSLFSISSPSKNLTLMIKINNGYLLLRNYRN